MFALLNRSMQTNTPHINIFNCILYSNVPKLQASYHIEIKQPMTRRLTNTKVVLCKNLYLCFHQLLAERNNIFKAAPISHKS